MNTNGDLQFVYDLMLLDKLATIEFGLQKSAGLADTIKSSLQSVIQSVKDRVEQEGVLGALATYFSIGFAKSIWWPLSIAAVVADQMFSISLGSIMNQIYQKLKSKIQSGEQISPNEVNEMGKEVISAHGGEDSAASDDMLFAIREAETNNLLVRLAQFRGKSSALASLFGKVGRKRGIWLIGGLLVAFIKAVLWGAGLLSVGAVAKSLISGDDKEDEEEPGAASVIEKKPEPRPYRVKPLQFVPQPIQHNLSTTGKGQNRFVNDGINRIWTVPIGSSLPDAIMNWAGYVYSDLQGKRAIIATDPAFNNLVSSLKPYVDRSHLLVPPNFHSIKEIVDVFAGSVANKLNIKETK